MTGHTCPLDFELQKAEPLDPSIFKNEHLDNANMYLSRSYEIKEKIDTYSNAYDRTKILSVFNSDIIKFSGVKYISLLVSDEMTMLMLDWWENVTKSNMELYEYNKRGCLVDYLAEVTRIEHTPHITLLSEKFNTIKGGGIAVEGKFRIFDPDKGYFPYLELTTNELINLTIEDQI